MKTAVYGSTLIITGLKRGRMTYRVTLDPSIRDTFDQTLGTSVPLTFTVGSAPPALAGSDKDFIVLDPSAQPRYSLYSVNIPTLKVRLYSVTPENWAGFLAFMKANNENVVRTPPGRLVYSDIVPVQAQPDEMAETRIDLSRALNQGLGHVIVIVESTI